jgi:hypothetical protein
MSRVKCVFVVKPWQLDCQVVRSCCCVLYSVGATISVSRNLVLGYIHLLDGENFGLETRTLFLFERILRGGEDLIN